MARLSSQYRNTVCTAEGRRRIGEEFSGRILSPSDPCLAVVQALDEKEVGLLHGWLNDEADRRRTDRNSTVDHTLWPGMVRRSQVLYIDYDVIYRAVDHTLWPGMVRRSQVVTAPLAVTGERRRADRRAYI